ncbi:MAG TPA: glycosyltransferase [Leptolyngbyaceae cyanobacterium M65_K2018_010]|nr:glycosyltransferase [Leptolyngbyaceae cyanobacterium M65_K2018_010]
MTEVQQRLEETNSVLGTAEPFVSVIVPVYNDADRLKKCLAALEQQTYHPGCFEVIVVDNGSDPDQNVNDCAAKFDHVIVTHESLPSSYAARNKGISVAKGEILAFTDADCIPANDWLEKGIKYLVENPNCGSVGGRIQLFLVNPGKVTPVDLYDQVVFGFPQEDLIKRNGGIITANLLTRKSVIEHVGGFCSSLKSFGDQEWGMRVKAAGYEQLYASDARVFHPTRSSLEDLLQRQTRYAGGLYDCYIRSETSLWVRNRRFVRFIVSYLLLFNFDWVKRVLTDPRLEDNKTRFKVFTLAARLQLASALEIVRLKFGGASKR